MLVLLNNSHIIFGAIRCLNPYISKARIASNYKRYCHYELNVELFLDVYLFCCSVFDYGTS